MLAFLMLLVYLAAGVAIMRWQLPGAKPLVRGWLGCSAGLLLLMWLPALWAFTPIRFSVTGHVCALGCLVGIVGAAYLFRDRRPALKAGEDRTYMRWLLLCLVVPLCVLGAYLQYTHVLRPDAAGVLHVGQATYGDLNLHLGIATSLRDAAFPPEYSILPGTKLGYPFLGDTLSTSMLLFGLPLRWAIIVPGTLMMGLVFVGYLLLAERVLGRRPVVIGLAVLLFFLNGGLGFVHQLDMSLRDPSRLEAIFTGFYKTPTNQPDLNLRWSNVIADLMVPQRTLLTGWMLVLPALYLLYDGIETRALRTFVLLAIFAAGMPLVHTHSFLALGLCSGGWLCYALWCSFREGRRASLIAELPRAEGFRLLRCAGVYLAITLALALPQLIEFAFDQTLSGNSLRLQFNWVNNSAGRGMIDGYFWFWIKNVGPGFILLLCALLDADKRRRLLASGAFAIFVVAEIWLFQPNEYDNNKLFYVWYMLAALLIADYAALLWRKLSDLRGRWILAAVFVVASLLSGSLSIAREVVSDYQLFSADSVACAAYAEAEIPRDAVFLTGEQHQNPIAALAGRKIVCGTTLYLHFHGLYPTERRMDIQRFYLDPANNLDVLKKYGVTHILFSDYERGDYGDKRPILDTLFPASFEEGDYTIYEVPGDEG